jgi:methionyl-tRNA formyltransferase
MRLIMMGTGDFAVPTFRELLDRHCDVRLLVTQPDRPQGRHMALRPAAIKELAVQRGVTIFQPEDVNGDAAIEQLAATQPDLLVVAAYGQILSAKLLGISRRGGVNLHGSLLPRYRGAAPVQWAIYHGETTTGVTVIHMNRRVDAGGILLQAETPVDPAETADSLERRLAQLGGPLVCQAIDGLAAGTLVGRPQDRSQVTRAPKLRKEHGLIDWSRAAQQVVNQVRAMQPWPGAYAFWQPGGREAIRLNIEQARVVAGAPRGNAPEFPGMVVQVTSQDVHVRTGDGLIALLTVRPAGKRSMPVAEFLHGHRVAAGDRFGPPPDEAK